MVEGLGSTAADDIARCKRSCESPGSCRFPTLGNIGPEGIQSGFRVWTLQFAKGLVGMGLPMGSAEAVASGPSKFDGK